MSLRRVHNACKRRLIQHCVNILQLPRGLADCIVVDFACGRGGDLNKVMGCKQYTGVDAADQALVELQRRAAELHMDVRVHLGDAADVPVTRCHLALCNFALHYFCDTKEHCTALLHKISECLEPNAVFCGTYERVPGADLGMKWGTRFHAVVGDCVDAVEWRVPWHAVCAAALRVGLAVVHNQPLTCIHGEAALHVWSFIFQKQR